MVSLVGDLRNALYSHSILEIGRILNENWNLKQQLASGISNPLIDEVYHRGLKAGALGGKLLGAGGGGFMLFLCEPALHAKLDEALSQLRPFDFKFDQEGSKVIYLEEE